MPATPYLTPEQVRERAPRLPKDAQGAEIIRLVAEFEEIAEQYRGVAFTDREPAEDAYPGTVYPSPPQVVLRACAEYVSMVITSTRSGTSRDVIGQSIDGNYTRYSTPDWGAGRPTGWLEVDRLLNSLPDYRCIGIG